jgi:hypothetical protein
MKTGYVISIDLIFTTLIFYHPNQHCQPFQATFSKTTKYCGSFQEFERNFLYFSGLWSIKDGDEELLTGAFLAKSGALESLFFTVANQRTEIENKI